MNKTFSCGFTSSGREFVKCIAISSIGNVFTGKAICSPEDEFSLKFGIELAEARAEYKQAEKIRKSKVVKRNLAYTRYIKAQKELGKITSVVSELDYKRT